MSTDTAYRLRPTTSSTAGEMRSDVRSRAARRHCRRKLAA
jgi:hypothetical protein